jgi:hypothetical protein
MSADKGVENSSEAEWSREVMFRAAVDPSMDAAGNAESAIYSDFAYSAPAPVPA